MEIHSKSYQISTIYNCSNAKGNRVKAKEIRPLHDRLAERHTIKNEGRSPFYHLLV